MIDDDLSREILIKASLAGATGVLLGALGAHGLDEFLLARGMPEALVDERVDQFNIGVRYHMVHAVALLALASVPFGTPRLRRWVTRLFVAGLFLFSGSLYLLALTNTPQLGAITPLGGIAWIAGWICLLPLAWKRSKK